MPLSSSLYFTSYNIVLYSILLQSPYISLCTPYTYSSLYFTSYLILLCFNLMHSPNISFSTPYTRSGLYFTSYLIILYSSLLYCIHPTFHSPLFIPAQVVFPECLYPKVGTEPIRLAPKRVPNNPHDTRLEVHHSGYQNHGLSTARRARERLSTRLGDAGVS